MLGLFIESGGLLIVHASMITNWMENQLDKLDHFNFVWVASRVYSCSTRHCRNYLVCSLFNVLLLSQGSVYLSALSVP